MKIKIIAVAKDEAAYIPVWIFHHLNFGFDEIEIILNRTSDNSLNLIKSISKNYSQVKYSECDWIDLLSDGVKSMLQTIAYAESYVRAKNNGFSHVFFLDIDEFWTPLDFKSSIKDFLISKNPDASISFNWLCELGTDDEFSMIQNVGRYILSPRVKTIVCCNSDVKKIRIHAPVFHENSYHILANGNKFVPHEDGSQLCRKDTVVLMDAFVIHRMYRSEREYVSTLLRGNPETNGLSFKKNRIGFLRSHQEEIKLNLNLIEYSRYVKSYEKFIENLNLKNEILISRSYVINRAEDAIKLLEKQIISSNDLVKKIFSGVGNPRVVSIINNFELNSNDFVKLTDGLLVGENKVSKSNILGMKISEIVQALRVSSPELLGQLSDQRLVAIIGAALAQVAAAVRDTEEGQVQVPRLGRFAVRQVLREAEGGEGEMVKRVVFHPAPVPAAASSPDTPSA